MPHLRHCERSEAIWGPSTRCVWNAGLRRRTRNDKDNAFTLIEALVASVLLGVGVVGLMSAATMGQRNSQRSEQRTMAMYLAQEKMGEVEAAGPHVWSLGQPMKGTEDRKGIMYDWTIKIDRLAAGELFDVRVTVDWAAATGRGSVDLETWLNDYRAKLANLATPNAPGQSGTPANSRQR